MPIAPPESPASAPPPGTAGTSIIRGPFAFSHSTVGLNNGMALFTPAVGDIILDFWIESDIAFNGTTPKGDIGTFSGGNNGILVALSLGAFDMTSLDMAIPTNAGLLFGASAENSSSLSAKVLSVGILDPGDAGRWQIAVTAANPLLLVVSQTGVKGGTATGATVGAGKVYVQTATPLGS